MASKVALRTLLLAAVWLLYQNFNFHPVPDPFSANDKQAPATALPLEERARSGLRKGNHSSHTCPDYGCHIHHRPATFKPQTFKPQTSNFLPPYKIKTIVLDAGHGGKDPGCPGTTLNEKHNTLAIVLKLGALIESKYPDIKVIYTRDTDVFIELNERAAIANRNKADLFISVHCNSLSVASAKGTETYVMGLHTAKHNLEVAKRENSSIYLEENYEKNYEGYDPNSPEAHIIGSVFQSAYLEQSILFASLVQYYAHVTAEREDRGVKQAGFLVLRETAMPSVLIESGYLTNVTEDAFIASDEGREKIAMAVFQAFGAYKTQLEEGKKAIIKPVPAKPKTKQPVAQTPPIATKGPQPNTAPPAAAKTLDKQSDAQTKPMPAKILVKKTEAVATVYRIHLLSWATKMDRDSGQMGLISGIKEEQSEGQYHYFTSTFATRAEAEELLPEIKNLGFRTAKIVAVSKVP